MNKRRNISSQIREGYGVLAQALWIEGVCKVN
ncbi:uncharacterized protein METZ01_LOCUS447549 [marine metagenome]|uniref:Uncharacterized protein n=1 Tax=marine metagenome TaxID=408172 RepID=A0A382ZHZ9_9ZZZZ